MWDFLPGYVIVLLAALTLFVIVWERHKHPKPKGIGARVIQLFAVVVLIPSIVLLSLAGKLEGQATATLLGTIVGYVLSGIGKDEPTPKGTGAKSEKTT